MKQVGLCALVVAVGLAVGCSPAPGPSDEVAQATSPAESVPAEQAADDQSDGAKAPAVPEQDSGPARWDGYGDVRLGMDEAAFRAAWDGELKADEPMEGSSCRHMAPVEGSGHAGVAFMFDQGRFVRYATTPDSQLVAPGGGKRGMDRQQIEALYPGKVKADPHVYVVGGHYLRVVDGKSVLVFETDEAGKVTGWRVGHEPQVDWVEGCS